MTPPRLSVVVPTYNGRPWLGACLESLRRHGPAAGIRFEVLVVDDASTDGTADWVTAHFPEFILIRRPLNGGFVAAANTGIEAARGEFIQLLNHDTEVTPGWIEAGLLPFRDPGVGSVAPLAIFRSEPDRVDSAGDGYSLLGWPYKRGHGEPVAIWSGAETAGSVFGASGSSAFYRAAVLRRLGGFDPVFGSYYEDVDLAFRLRWAGYACVFAPRCRILHEVSVSYDHRRPELQRQMSRNAELLFWSNLPARWLILAALPHVAFTLAQALVRACRGRLRPLLLGKLDALRLGPELVRQRRIRRELARNAGRRPRFPMAVVPLRAARNHLTRPRRAQEEGRIAVV